MGVTATGARVVRNVQLLPCCVGEKSSLMMPTALTATNTDITCSWSAGSAARGDARRCTCAGGPVDDPAVRAADQDGEEGTDVADGTPRPNEAHVYALP